MQTKTKQTSNNKMLAIAILVSMFILVFFVSIFAGIYVLVKNNPNFQKIYSELETGKSNTAPTNLQNQNPKSETNIDQPSYQELKLAYDELIKQNAELEKKVLELQPKTESMQTQSQITINPQPACKQLKIYEGKFASDKCYSAQDYNDLTYYLGRYNNMVFDYNSAVSSMRITCNGSEFFEDDCKQDKKEKEEASDKMAEYETKINDIMSRGR